MQTVPVTDQLRNSVLAQDVLAATDLPRTRTTNVDGYALKVVQGSGKAGKYEVRKFGRVDEGEEERVVVRVNTGGPLPDGFDSVVMVEDTLVSKGSCRTLRLCPLVELIWTERIC
jgi:gephyrin